MHYGAVSWRLHEDDFRARSQTIERYGASAIPADSSLADWPLSYKDLEPFYDRAEYELGVSGKAGNLQGRKIDGGNVFEGPRQRDYPNPPLKRSYGTVLFDKALDLDCTYGETGKDAWWVRQKASGGVTGAMWSITTNPFRSASSR